MLRQGRLVPLLTQHQRHLTGASSLRGLATVVNRPKLPFDETCSSVTPPYSKLVSNLRSVKRILDNEPLTLAEKILYSHLDNAEESLAAGKGNIRGQSYLKLNPDRVAMQDASAQMAILQFMASGLDRTAVPTSIHCDHLIVGNRGAKEDLKASIDQNREIFEFLGSAAQKYGIQFWGPGSGIIHQIVLENYSAPGLMMLGTDSHTPNAGGLGAIAIGVGGADAVDPMTGQPWEVKAPKILGVELTGVLTGWASPKDVILKLAGMLTVRGGTGYIIEYFGSGVEKLSCTGMATICNMGAEVGATTSLFPFTQASSDYLSATHRAPVAKAASKVLAESGLLAADKGAQYDKVIQINLSELEPHINGPFTPDLSTPLSQFREKIHENNWPTELSVGLIGSCTNSSYEDMTRAVDIARQATAAGLKAKVPFLVTPGSEQIRATIERDGLTEVFENVGGKVLANACGPCIGQWTRTDIEPSAKVSQENAILSSFNRNFRARNDGNPGTMNFLTSPELTTAMTFSGSMEFNPMTDSLVTPSGEHFKFTPPSGESLPSRGFNSGDETLCPPPNPQPVPSTEIIISPTSDRLQVLEPFSHFTGDEFTNLRVLVKVKGKCTTDHISAAGKWLKYKGHLENIANNTLIGAMNAETDEVNVVYDYEGDGKGVSIPDLGRRWKDRGQEWIVVAEHNYGEGSAREHASLQVRYLGGRIVLVKSFARIHETNLKKQGVLPLTFVDENDYDLVNACDKVDTRGIREMISSGGQGGGEITLKVTKKNGEVKEIRCRHTMSKDQVRWFVNGSAINRDSSAM